MVCLPVRRPVAALPQRGLVSDLDGCLTPEGVDWLLFDARLSAKPTITLSVDDGLHEPVEVSVRSRCSPFRVRRDLPEPGTAVVFAPAGA